LGPDASVASPPHSKNERSTQASVRWIADETAGYRPDVVHAGPLDSAAWLAAQAGVSPLIGASWAFDLLDPRPDERRRRRAQAALDAASLLIVDALSVEREARARGYRGDIVRFPWGIDLDRFQPPTTHRHGSPPRVICARSMEPMYRVGDVVAAFARARISAGLDLRLDLISDGSERPAIESQIHQLRIGQAVHVTGRVPEPALARHLADADVYVSPARVDGSSITLLQAMATGLPVVATDIPGNREWLDGTFGQWLVAVGDIQSLADAIAAAAALTRRDRETIAHRHRQIVEARADWTSHRHTLVAAYERFGPA